MTTVAKIRTLSFGEALEEASRWLEARGLGASGVGVDGHSAGGKSTFAEAMARRAGAAVVRGDDFYRVMDDVERAELSPAEGVERYYDWQRLRDQVLSVVRAGATARYRPYDWLTGHLAPHFVTVQAAAICRRRIVRVTAGVGDLRRPRDPDRLARDRSTTQADRASRRVQRMAGALGCRERYFFEQIRPPATFDIVVRDR